MLWLKVFFIKISQKSKCNRLLAVYQRNLPVRMKFIFAYFALIIGCFSHGKNNRSQACIGNCIYVIRFISERFKFLHTTSPIREATYKSWSKLRTVCCWCCGNEHASILFIWYVIKW